jgi:hypothetical protein
VLPLANLLLGSAFRFENGLAARLADIVVVGLGQAVATGLSATLAPGGLVAVQRKVALLAHEAAAGACAGIGHSVRQQTDGGRKADWVSGHQGLCARTHPSPHPYEGLTKRPP